MIDYVVGIDEAGRGPLAGPLSVAAVCLPIDQSVNDICVGVADSKQLSAEKREELFFYIINHARWAHVHIMPTSLDRLGMTKALSTAVARVLAKLNPPPERAEIKLDGTLKAPPAYARQKTITKGDITEPIISAASIVAKVRRDRSMIRYAKQFPQYGFERHKGYGTSAHRQAIEQHGPCRIHRKRFLKSVVSGIM